MLVYFSQKDIFLYAQESKYSFSFSPKLLFYTCKNFFCFGTTLKRVYLK